MVSHEAVRNNTLFIQHRECCEEGTMTIQALSHLFYTWNSRDERDSLANKKQFAFAVLPRAKMSKTRIAPSRTKRVYSSLAEQKRTWTSFFVHWIPMYRALHLHYTAGDRKLPNMRDICN